MQARTLLSALENTSHRYGDRGFTFPPLDESLTYAVLVDEAKLAARGLVAAGLQKGQVVGLCLPNGRDFLVAYFACLYAGAAPATLSMPLSSVHARSHAAALRKALDRADARFLFIDHTSPAFLAALDDGEKAWRLIQLAEITSIAPRETPLPDATPSDVALIQFTSGSTSRPRGVELSHASLLAGLDAIVKGANITSEDINNQWLPLHHDMGMIGLLACVTQGAAQHVWTPLAFAKNPSGWLAHFARTRSTLYAGPQFSYNLLRSAVAEVDVATLDLSSWRVAFNGSEPVIKADVEAFAEHFARAAFRPETMFPVYGLAEATLAASFPELGTLPAFLSVDRRHLAPGDQVVPLPSGTTGAVDIACLGTAVHGHAVAVVDDDGRPVTGRIGEIWVTGSAVMQGYHNDQPATNEALRDGWLRTGDLGFVVDGRLYVTGRCKEMIIVRGRKFYPHDVEAALPGMRCAAVAAGDWGAERIAVILEPSPRMTQGRDDLARQIARDAKRTVQERLGLNAIDVYVVRPKTLQRTTSGKLRRTEMRRLLAAGELEDRILSVV